MTWRSHQNGSETAETSRHLAEGLKAIYHIWDLNRLNGELRRSAHIVIFAMLTVLPLLKMMAGKIKDRRIAVCLLVLWSMIYVDTKPLIQGRHFSWQDVGLNLIGVGIGSLHKNKIIPQPIHNGKYSHYHYTIFSQKPKSTN